MAIVTAKASNQKSLPPHATSLNSCMWYKELNNNQIKLKAKEELEFDAGTGTILIPMTEARLFLHWYNDKGKMVSSHQLKFSTLVTNKVKLINSENKDAVVLRIETPNA